MGWLLINYFPNMVSTLHFRYKRARVCLISDNKSGMIPVLIWLEEGLSYVFCKYK